jgi:hypothetical protein
MKAQLLLVAFLPSFLLAQSTPPANFQNTPTTISYLRGYGDTIDFEGYPSNSVITDQYFSNGAIFSGYSGSGNPVTYDYGITWTSTLHSDDWYNPLRLKFVYPSDSGVSKPISSLTFYNPISVEIDYIKVVIYDENDSAVASYLSTSPEWVTINLGSNIGAYAVFDDSASTAYVIDEVSFTQGGKATGIAQLSPLKNYSIAYPNPFTSSTAIMIDPQIKVTGATLEIYDALGKLVRQTKEVTRNSIVIERENLPDGFYHYQLNQQDKKISDGIIVVQ